MVQTTASWVLESLINICIDWRDSFQRISRGALVITSEPRRSGRDKTPMTP